MIELQELDFDTFPIEGVKIKYGDDGHTTAIMLDYHSLSFVEFVDSYCPDQLIQAYEMMISKVITSEIKGTIPFFNISKILADDYIVSSEILGRIRISKIDDIRFNYSGYRMDVKHASRDYESGFLYISAKSTSAKLEEGDLITMYSKILYSVISGKKGPTLWVYE
jgi:hypothetical protein